MLVTGGKENFQSQQIKVSEVIDLNDPTRTCQNLPDFPFETEGIGGLLDNIPVVCSGNTCQGIGQKFEVEWNNEMIGNVDYAASVVIQDGLWITGGNLVGSKTLLVRPDESVILQGSALPQTPYLQHHCVVIINAEECMIIGGGPDSYQATWTYNFKSGLWTRGPDTNVFRWYHACGLFTDLVENKQKVLIAGGAPPGASPDPNKDSTEILDFEVANSEWIYGKELDD